MDIINSINEIMKNEKNIIFLYGFILIIVYFILENYDDLPKKILLFLIGFYFISYLDKSKKKKSEEKIFLTKNKLPKNCKKINKDILNLDNELVLKNILLNLSYYKKYNRSAIKNIIKNISNFSKINKKPDIDDLKINIEKLINLKSIIINDIHSIVYSLPSLQYEDKNDIYLQPLIDKLIFCLNKFISYADENISKKININNENFKNNKNNSSKYIDEIEQPQAYNSIKSVI